MTYLFQSPHFQFVSLGLKCVSCTKDIYGSWLPFFVFCLENLLHLHLRCNYWYVWSHHHFLYCFGFIFVGLFFLLCFLFREIPLVFIVKLVWWCWILLTFGSLQSFWFLHQTWMITLLSRVILVAFFSFHYFKYILHSLLTCRVSVEISAVSLMEIPLYIISCFSLVAFNCFHCVYISLAWLICFLACFSLGSSCMGVSGLPGPGWLFLFPY